jgi:hypothetical protein
VSRTIHAKICFTFDEDRINEAMTEEGDNALTDEQLVDYVVDTFVDDVYDMVKRNDLTSTIRVTFTEQKEIL